MCRYAVVEPQNPRRAVLAGAIALLVAACGGGGATPASAIALTGSSPSPTALTASIQSSLAPPAGSPSDAPAGTPTPAPVDPCSLVTRAEANAVAGVQTLPPEPAGDPPTRCVWATPTNGAIGQVELDIGDGAKKAYDIDNTVLKHAFKPISGLGNEAYAEDGSVFFRKGDTWIGIHIVRLDDSKLWMPKLIALAMTVAGRI